MKLAISTTEARRAEVYDIVLTGSNPRAAFFMMVALSTLIAAFGLLMNSTAVVIGAMLVAPLMTPILGLGLALVRGDSALLGLSIRAEVLGIVIAIAAATLLGFLFPEIEATQEMLGRTRPILLDLFVAVLAGLAGAYAVVDEKISPALPGVAISTAIVPPLANVGLSLADGSYEGAWGSFLLFFTNFLSILLASAVIFYVAGMAEKHLLRKKGAITRRFGIAIAGFIIVAALLTQELSDMFHRIALQNQIREVLEQDLTRLRVSEIANMNFEETDNGVVVFARIHAPNVISPRQIRFIERNLKQRLEMPVELFVRSTLTRDVSATGSVDQGIFQTLDGLARPADTNDELANLRIAEQTIREYLGDKIQIDLRSIDSFIIGDETYFHAEIYGWRSLQQSEIAELETLLRQRMPAIGARLIVIQEAVEMKDKDGRFRPEFVARRALSSEEKTNVDGMWRYAKRYLKAKDYAMTSWSVTILEDTYYAFFDVVGAKLLPQAEVTQLNNELKRNFNVPIEIYVRSTPETVMTKDGYTTLDEVLTTFHKRTRRAFSKETERLLSP